jgi:hypothetical protein
VVVVVAVLAVTWVAVAMAGLLRIHLETNLQVPSCVKSKEEPVCATVSAVTRPAQQPC